MKVGSHKHEWKRYVKAVYGVELLSWFCACGTVDVYDMVIASRDAFNGRAEFKGDPYVILNVPTPEERELSGVQS